MHGGEEDHQGLGFWDLLYQLQGDTNSFVSLRTLWITSTRRIPPDLVDRLDMGRELGSQPDLFRLRVGI